jgi:hypothetical protein
MEANDELGRMWKEGFVIYFKALFQYFPELTEETHDSCLSIAGLRYGN